jgi:hypothetical protein
MGGNTVSRMVCPPGLSHVFVDIQSLAVVDRDQVSHRKFVDGIWKKTNVPVYKRDVDAPSVMAPRCG